MTLKTLKENLKELSEIYDANSMDTFISLYLNRRKNGKFIERREKACRSILKEKELENFIKTMEDIKKFLAKNSDERMAIFASHKNGFFKSISLPIDIENFLIVDSSPYLRPLARLVDEWESFTLLLMNSNHAKIFSISIGEVKEESEISAEIMNKHKKGGWSQARFQRLRKGEIHAFFLEVTNALQKIAGERILLAGPGKAKDELANSLPKDMKEKIVEIIDIDIDDERELMKESINLMLKKEKMESHLAVQQLKGEILKDGLGVGGIKDTTIATRNGQAELLLIEKGYRAKGWICENCQAVEEGKTAKCPYCGRKTSEVDIVEEIIEFAERTDTKIEFVDGKELKELGHVGALLRYK